MKRAFSLFLLIFFLQLVFIPSHPVKAEEFTLESLLLKIKSTQAKILDLKANTTTNIVSNFQDKEIKMTQIGKIWTKGTDKSKIEVVSPNHQITITNGSKMAIFLPDTGQKQVQDLSKIDGNSGIVQSGGPMNLDRALQYFDLQVTQTDTGAFLISGVPKQKNDFLGRMEFLLDPEKYVFTNISIFNPQGALISISKIEYVNISNCWVPQKNTTSMSLPVGSMNMEMVYDKIEVNSGISEDVFKIE